MKRMLTVLAYHMAESHRVAVALVCAVISAAVSQTVMADVVVKRTISAGPVLSSSGEITSYRVSVGPGEGSQGVYALYGTHEPTTTEMWEKVDFLGTVDAKGGKFTFVPQGEWSVVRFAVGQFYVRDGMLAYWDGIWNLRSGHSGSCDDGRPWENLVGVNCDFELKYNGTGGYPEVQARWIRFRMLMGYALLSAESTAATFGTLASTGGTMEVSLSADQDFKYYTEAILRSSDASNVAFWWDNGGCAFQGDNPTGGHASGAHGGGFNGITTVSVTYNENKLPSKARKDGVEMALTGETYGVPKSQTAGADRTIVGRLNAGDDYNQSWWSSVNLYAIRLYSRTLTAEEAARNAAVDKVRFAASGLMEMKEGVAESLSLVYGKAVDHVVSVMAHAVNPNSKNVSYDSYAVTVGAGTVKGELWMFYGKALPTSDGDYESWECKQKIADVPLVGGTWTVDRPQDSDWRSQGYAVRFAVLENYITDGLAGRFDGICNTRNGHSSTLTKWENLVVGKPDMIIDGTVNALPNALGFTGAANSRARMLVGDMDKMMPFDNSHNKTLDAVFKISAESDDSSDQILMHSEFRQSYTIISKPDCLVLAEEETQPWPIARDALKSLTTVAMRYQDWNPTRWIQTPAYINGVAVAKPSTGTKIKGWNGDYFYIGSPSFHGEFYALRGYTRDLTAEEFAHNAALDKVRFGSSCARSTIAGETIAGESEIIWSARDPQGLVIVVE